MDYFQASYHTKPLHFSEADYSLSIELNEQSFFTFKYHGNLQNTSIHHDESFFIFCQGYDLNYTSLAIKRILTNKKNLSEIRHLPGFFCCLILNKENKKFFCLSDKLGIYSIYYTQQSHQLFLSNRMKEIIPYLDTRKINMGSVYEIMHRGFIMHPETLITNLFTLAPFHYLSMKDELNLSELEAIEYQVVEKSEHLAIEQLNQTLSRLLNNQSEIALMCSGGLDSLFLAAFLIKKGLKPTLFTIKSNSHEYLNLLNYQAKTQCHLVEYQSNLDNWLENFMEALTLCEGEMVGTLAKNITLEYQFAKWVKQHHYDFVLTGDDNLIFPRLAPNLKKFNPLKHAILSEKLMRVLLANDLKNHYLSFLQKTHEMAKCIYRYESYLPIRLSMQSSSIGKVIGKIRHGVNLACKMPFIEKEFLDYINSLLIHSENFIYRNFIKELSINQNYLLPSHHLQTKSWMPSMFENQQGQIALNMMRDKILDKTSHCAHLFSVRQINEVLQQILPRFKLPLLTTLFSLEMFIENFL